MSPLHDYLSSLPQHEADALRMIAIAGFLHSIADTGVMSGAAGRAADKAFIQRLVRALALAAFGSAERFDAGMRALGGKPERGDPLQTWASAVGGAGRMLRLLADIHPKRLSRAELGRRLDLEVSGGTFGTYLSRLRSNGLIEEAGGEIAASDVLWR